MSPKQSLKKLLSPSRFSLDELLSNIENESLTSPPPGPELLKTIKEFRKKASPILGHHSKSRIDMAIAFHEMGLIEDALLELQKIKKKERCYFEALTLMGIFLFGSHQLETAKKLALKTICFRTLSRTLLCENYYLLVQIGLALKDLSLAENYYRKLVKISPAYRNTRELKRQIELFVKES